MSRAQTRWLALGFAIALVATGCASPAVGPALNFLDARVDAAHPATFKGLPLANGQLILTEAPGPYSLLFALAPATFYRFTHAAIVAIEDGEPFVYDISGTYKPGFHDRPTDAIHGGMRVLALSVITDRCLPDALEPADVSEIIAVANAAEPSLRTLITDLLASD